MAKNLNIALLGASLVFLFFLSGCATSIGKSNRVGLFDRLEGKGRGNGRKIASVDEKDLVETPQEGTVLELTGEWQWPLKNVEASSQFGERGRKFHQGVDFRAPTGTPVYAASDGKVIYVGSKIRGYGRMVVIKHADNIFTVYGHHSKNLVKSGENVQRGDLIAFSGRSGRVTGPHLHFEIRKGTVSFDPVLAINERLNTLKVDRRFASVKEQPISRKKRRSRTTKKSKSSSSKTALITHTSPKNL